MSRRRLWLPLAAFLALVIVVAFALYRPHDPTVRSRLVGQPLPAFALAPLIDGKPGVRSGAGGARLLNVFASWCIPCAAEAPQLMALQRAGVAIDGIAIRDTAPAVQGFLAQNGDPYRAIGADPESRVQLSLGSSGVPESFVIGTDGRIVLQHIGDIRAEDVPEILTAVRNAS